MAAILPRYLRYQPKFANKIRSKYINLPRKYGPFAPIHDTNLKELSNEHSTVSLLPTATTCPVFPAPPPVARKYGENTLYSVARKANCRLIGKSNGTWVLHNMNWQEPLAKNCRTTWRRGMCGIGRF